MQFIRNTITLFPRMVFLLAVCMAMIGSCSRPEPVKYSPKPSELEEPLIEANKKAVLTETEQINDFIRRYKWKMQETGSGLRYMIYREGQGPEVAREDGVEITYSITLLNGDTVYTSREKGHLVFIIGRAQVISGLEEGILLLRQGDRAKFIIPSHLAHGLVGDGDRIGQKSTLVYDVQVLKIKKIHQ